MMSEDRTLSGGYHPILDNFLGNLPAGSANADWAKGAADKIQDYLSLRAHVNAANSAENQWTGDLSATQNNLVGMVKSDPLSADLALSLAGDAADALTSHHPDEDQRAKASADIARGMRQQIAHTAVQEYAATNKDAAHSLVDKYAGHFDEGEGDALKKYADNLDMLRQADKTASRQETVRQALAVNKSTATDWLGQLTHPETGETVFPQGWGTNMMQDGRLSGDTKASLHTAYLNLQRNGDQTASDPSTLVNLLGRATLPHNDPDHPLATEVVSQVGSGLTLGDAQWLLGKTGPQGQQTKTDLQALHSLVSDAREEIGNPSAFGRFVNWLMPAVRNGASIDRDAPTYVLRNDKIDEFMPTGDDLIRPAQEAVGGVRKTGLAEIFGGIFGNGAVPDELVRGEGQNIYNQSETRGVNPAGYQKMYVPGDTGIYGEGKPQQSGDEVLKTGERFAPTEPVMTPNDLQWRAQGNPEKDT